MHLVRRAQALEDQFFVDTKPIELGITDAARDDRRAGAAPGVGVFVLFRREAFSLTFFLVSLVTGQRGSLSGAAGRAAWPSSRRR